MKRPDIIVPDAGPLTHLAQADALGVLHQVGRRSVVADMVAFGVTQDMDKPGASQLGDWLRAGQAPGSNAPISVEETSTGRLFALARQPTPKSGLAMPASARSPTGWLRKSRHRPGRDGGL